MKNKIEQLKLVFLPYLLLTILSVIGLGWLRWLLEVKYGILNVKENLVNFWVPFLFPWVLILSVLRNRIKILKVNGKKEKGHFIYQMVVSLCIFIVLMFSQRYVQKEFFPLIKKENIAAITTQGNEKFFQVKNYTVDKELKLAYATKRISGRSSSQLTLYLYFAIPFEKGGKLIWYGKKYRKSLRNSKREEEKKKIYEEFIKSSYKDLAAADLNKDVYYFEKSPYSDDFEGYANAIRKKYPSVDITNLFVLVPQYDTYSERTGKTLYNTYMSLGISTFIVFLMVVLPGVDKRELMRVKEGRPIKDDYIADVLGFFNPFGGTPGIAVLSLAIIAVFLWSAFYGLNIAAPSADKLLELGGVRRAEVLQGEYWRLFSAVFIHGGILHLFYNVFALVLSGLFLEKILKPFLFILLFVLTGVAGSVASVYWYENMVSVGASGGIFGLYGIMIVFALLDIFEQGERPIAFWLAVVLGGVSLVIGIYTNADNAAHVGGLIAGFLLGGLTFLLYKDRIKIN